MDERVSLMLCLAVIPIACHDLHNKPVIIRPRTKRTVMIAPGTDADLICEANGVHKLTIQWTLNDSPIDRSEYAVYSDQPSTLTRSNIIVVKEGQYRCIAEMSGHATTSPAITLQFTGDNSWTYVAGGCTVALLMTVLVFAWRRGLFKRLVGSYITPTVGHSTRAVDNISHEDTSDGNSYEIIPEGESDEDDASAAASNTPYEQLELELFKGQEDYTHILRSINYANETPLHLQDGSSYASDMKKLRLSVSDLLRLWRFNTVDELGEVEITINHTDILQIVRTVMRQQDFVLQYPLTVKFRDKKLFNKFAEDGTTKSFFIKLMQALKTEILEGEEPHLGFRKKKKDLKSGCYREAGKMIAWSILHSGVGFPYFTISTYNFLVEKDIKCIRLEDINNPHIYNALERIMSCSTTKELRGVFDKDTITLIKGTGRSPNCLVIEEKEDLVRHMWMSYMFERVHMEIEQFKSGLADLGLMGHLTESPDTLEVLFVHKSAQQSGTLTCRHLKDLFQAVLSPAGTQDREEENDTLVALEDFLKICEDNESEVKLGDILRFWTGSDVVQSEGYTQGLTVKFVPKRCYPPSPVANPSALVLELMRGYNLDQLAANMSAAVLRS
ncbi:uncharacterized protein LOC124111998 [Haliotis rufescens]|uniref:uncharacterized protein LOC124111998 n=1 Tax=Haliotis rufescens TaxID=6454 RepID=UPI00201F6A8F|nr:uncharacterized protein LOC124111998 [Haliotis rufescens]